MDLRLKFRISKCCMYTAGVTAAYHVGTGPTSLLIINSLVSYGLQCTYVIDGVTRICRAQCSGGNGRAAALNVT